MIGPPSLSPSSVVALTGNKSDSCQLSPQNATNHEGQMTGVHGMGGYWTGLDHERWHSGVSGAFANNIGKDVGKGGISALCRSAIVTGDLNMCCLVLAGPTERLS